MDWSASTWWWLAAGVLVAAELVTGTFYLLMLAVGAAVAAFAGHLGLAGSTQVVVAALAGGGATAVWHFRRMRSPRSAPAAFNRDVLLDIGETVHVAEWQADGTARAQYRGAAWSVRFAGTGTPAPGRFVIVAIQGSQLSVAAQTVAP
jgi:membrane protein implicated in regulation of membrane protease activity